MNQIKLIRRLLGMPEGIFTTLDGEDCGHMRKGNDIHGLSIFTDGDAHGNGAGNGWGDGTGDYTYAQTHTIYQILNP